MQPNPQVRLTLEEALAEVAEQAAVIARVEASHELDYNGTRRKWADEAAAKLRQNMLTNKLTENSRNGHGGKIPVN